MVTTNNNISTTLSLSKNRLSMAQGTDLDSSSVHHDRVLVIDDDPDFISMTKLILCKAGFDVAGALGCHAALEKCTEVKPDVILLDLMMPEADGYETFERLQKITHAPVIVVTASGNRDHAAKSLQAGMEDYISKPFYNSEMVARIQAVIKRTKRPEEGNVKEFPEVGLTIKFDTQEVYRSGRFIRLVPRQFSVFSLLAQQAPRPVLYASLTEKIWGEDSDRKRAHLKNIVFSIRQKLEDEPSNPKLLINYRSLGYRLVTQAKDL